MAQALVLALARIEQVRVGVDSAGVDAEVTQRPEPIDRRLEDKGGGRPCRVAGECHRLTTLQRLPGDRIFLGWRGEIVHDRIEESVQTFVGGRRAAEGRDERTGADGPLQGRIQLRLGDRLVVEELLDQRIVVLGDTLDQLRPVPLDLIDQFSRDRPFFHRAIAPGVEAGAPMEDIDDPPERRLCADRHLQWHDAAPQTFLGAGDRAREVGILAVHLIDINQA